MGGVPLMDYISFLALFGTACIIIAMWSDTGEQ